MLADIFTYSPFHGNGSVIELLIMAFALVFGTVAVLAFRDLIATRRIQVESGQNGELELIAKNNIVRGTVAVMMEVALFAIGLIQATQPPSTAHVSWVRYLSLLILVLIQALLAWLIVADYRTYYLLNDLIAKRIAKERAA